MSDRSDGYAAGLRWGKRDGDRLAGEAARELHRAQEGRDRLAAAVDRVREAWRVSTDYVLCACDEEFGHLRYHAEHIAEVTEAATRAAVAADIRALADEMRQSVDPLGADPDQLSYINCTYIDASMVDSLAARIAEGKQP